MTESTFTKKSGFARGMRVLANATRSGVNRELAGQGVRKTGEIVTHGEALAYAMASGDANPNYFDKAGAPVPPLYASKLLRDVLEWSILHKDLGANLLRLVHAEQSFTFHKPLTVGMELDAYARFAGVRDISTGELVDIDVGLEENGQPVVTGRGTMFIRGKKPSQGSKKSSKKADPPPLETIATYSISPDQPRRYAAASGDYNLIHTTPWFAKLSGFKGCIAHGLCVMARTTAELVNCYGGGDPTRLASISLRFAKPAYPGQELTLKTRQEGDTVQFALENPKGKLVLSMGQATFKSAD